MAIQASASPARSHVTPILLEAIHETVRYADIFAFPLTAHEVWRFLPVRTTPAEVKAAIRADLAQGERLESDGVYIYFSGRQELPALRLERERRADRAWKRARRYGRLLWALPFVRMVAVTGSLAMDSVDPGDDIDLLIVTERGRLWTTRGLIVLVCRMARLSGVTLCPNYLLTTGALRLESRTLYAAHELAQMVPLHGSEVARVLRSENVWCRSFLPNATFEDIDHNGDRLPPPVRIMKLVGERLLRLPPGERLERWEQRRRMAKLSARANADGDEVAYTADVCKGHDQGHGQRIMALIDSGRSAASRH